MVEALKSRMEWLRCPKCGGKTRVQMRPHLEDYGFQRRFAPRSKCPWGTPRNDRGGVLNKLTRDGVSCPLRLYVRIYQLRRSAFYLASSLAARFLPYTQQPTT